MRRALASVLAALLLLPGVVRAEEMEAKKGAPVVVTATKVETSADRVGASVSVITGEELQTYNYERIEEALRSVPGVDVQRSGSLGKTTTIRIRGANANQVQVLVDGMRVKSTTLGQFDFSDLSLDAIDRIEIVRGPQSTLHGADAIGGIVNVITRKGTGPPAGTIFFEGGSYQTFREQVGLAGSYGLFNFAVSGSRADSRGYERNFDNDDSEQTAFAGRVGFDFPWKGTFTLTGRYAKSNTDVPNQGFFPFDMDPDSQQQTEFSLYTVRYDQEIFPWWKVAVRAGQMWSNQGFQDGPNPPGDFAFTSQVNTKRREVEVLSTWEIAGIDTLTVGYENQRESGFNRGTFDASINTNSFFVHNELRLFNRLILGGGLRYDDNDAFGDELTPRFSVVVLVPETGTKFRGAYGEGFRAPTLNDLFFPDTTGFCPPFGNPDLKPEKSRSWEAGFDQKLWQNRVRFGATYFKNTFKNLISFVNLPPFCAQAANVGKARTEGFESYLEVEPLDWLLLATNYTFTDNEDLTNGGDLPRMSRHLWNGSITVTPHPKVSLFLQSYVTSKQFDPNAGPGGTGGSHNPGYYRIDVGGTVKLVERRKPLERLELTARIQNVTDNTYDEVFGFRSPGFFAMVGLRATFR
jgi:vitamin B12 transporter